MELSVTGSLVQAYMICQRQVWLLARQLIGNQTNDFLKIGRLLSNETYQREKKNIHIDGGILDAVQKKDGQLVIIETKKSSKTVRSGKMQLLFYLYKLKKKGIQAVGEIRVPKEKKILHLQLDEENQQEIEKVIEAIKTILKQEKPMAAKLIKYCKKCSYAEFCWS